MLSIPTEIIADIKQPIKLEYFISVSTNKWHLRRLKKEPDKDFSLSLLFIFSKS